MGNYCPDCGEVIGLGAVGCGCGWKAEVQESLVVQCQEPGCALHWSHSLSGRKYCAKHFLANRGSDWRENLLRAEAVRLGLKKGDSREACILALRQNGLALPRVFERVAQNLDTRGSGSVARNQESVS